MLSKTKDKFVSLPSIRILVKYKNLLSNKLFIVTSMFMPALKLITFMTENSISRTNPIETKSVTIWNRFCRNAWITWQDKNSKYR